MHVLDNIPFELNRKSLLSRLHLNESDAMAQEVIELVDKVDSVISPKVVYRPCDTGEKGADAVEFGGVRFTSRILRANLEDVQRVFAYVATCGNEVDALGLAAGDFVVQFWLDAIKEMALGVAIRHFREHLKQAYLLEKISSMNPGSGDADTWPIEQQKPLFSLFGNVEELIGVQLTESCLMVPNKSVSGIIFPTEVGFESCQVCQREDCPGRRAEYDPHFLESRLTHGCLDTP